MSTTYTPDSDPIQIVAYWDEGLSVEPGCPVDFFTFVDKPTSKCYKYVTNTFQKS